MRVLWTIGAVVGAVLLVWLGARLAVSPTERAISEVMYAEELMAAGEDDEAERFLRRAIRRQPRLAAAYHALGRLLEAKGRTDDARAAFATAREVYLASGRQLDTRGRLTADHVLALDAAATSAADSRRG